MKSAIHCACFLFALHAAAQDEGGFEFGADDVEEAAPPPDAPLEPPPDAPFDEAPVAALDDEDGASDGEKSAVDEGIDLTLQDRIKAVSRKVFLKQGRFELQPSLSVTTNDPFFRTWIPGGRASFHVNDALSLEVGGGYVPPFFVEKLPPVDILRETSSLINADADLLGLVDVGVTFSPIYGKIAVFSDQIIHFDTFVAAGGGAVFDTNKDFAHPAMDVGVGVRVFLLRWLVVRADLRDYVYPQDRANVSTLQNLLLASVGVGFYLPPDFEYRYEAAKVSR